MRTSREPRSATNANRSATRGVRILPDRVGRPSPYGVQWSVFLWDAGKGKQLRRTKSQFFPTQAARDGRAAKLREEKRAGALRALNRQEVDEYYAIKAAIGETPWQQVVAAWSATAVSLAAGSVTVQERVDDYLRRMKERVEQQSLAAGTYSQRKHKLKLFAGHFGHQALGAVKADDIKTWLAGFEHKNATTFNHYLKMVTLLFADAVIDGLLTANPCDRVRYRTVIQSEVGILTIPEIARLFNTALTVDRYRVCLRRLALETFAGVRYSSACRLTAADVNLVDRGIRHPARSIKTRKRQYVEGFPENLWAWIAVAPDDAKLTERQYLKRKSEVFLVAQIPHPRNCLRHSFCTYHLAARSNPGLTAVLLCHRNQQKLWESYKGNATAAQGRAFETLTPATCAEIARGDSPPSAVPAPSQDRPETLPVPADG